MKSATIYFLNFFIFSGIVSCQDTELGSVSKNEPKAPVVYSIGSSQNVETKTEFGIAMLGGAESNTEAEEAAFRFLVDNSGGGDFVVLRASGSDGYNSYIFNTIGGVNSVHSIVITSKEQATHPTTLKFVAEAEAIFLAGGDQSRYINFWKDTQLEKVLNEAINKRNIPIGGTSAGLAVLGWYYYGSQAGSAVSEEVLNNPYHPDMAGLDTGMLKVPYLQQVITDSHYSNRKRQGRHVAFMARLITDMQLTPSQIIGVGVDEATCFLVDKNGKGNIIGQGYVYILRAKMDVPEVCNRDQPLIWRQDEKAIEAYILAGTANGQYYFDFSIGNGFGGTKEYWYVDNNMLFRKVAD